MGSGSSNCCSAAIEKPREEEDDASRINPVHDVTELLPAESLSSSSFDSQDSVGVARGRARSTSDHQSSVCKAESSSSAFSTKSSVSSTWLSVTGLVPRTVQHTAIDQNKLEEFKTFLQSRGISEQTWSQERGAKTVESLYREVFTRRGCIIVPLENTVKIIIKLVKISIVADIFGVEHVLVLRLRCTHDRQPAECLQVPLKKLVWKSDVQDAVLQSQIEVTNASLHDPTDASTEDWREGCQLALSRRLGLSVETQKQQLREDHAMYRYTVSDEHEMDVRDRARSYPGMTNVYCTHEVGFQVVDQEHPFVRGIGLPHGEDFATAEGNFNVRLSNEDLPVGTELNVWGWMTTSAWKTRRGKAASTPSPPKPRPQMPPAHEQALHILRQRVRIDHESGSELFHCKSGETIPPNTVLAHAMQNERVSWEKVVKIGSNIASPSYTLWQFNLDLKLFPELGLYLVDDQDPTPTVPQINLASGRTRGDEYQRTVGAFFAVYWLMRLRLDGKEGFSFGVDDQWQPHKKGTDVLRTPTPHQEKRSNFYEKCEWKFLEKLLVDAELVVRNPAHTKSASSKWRIPMRSGSSPEDGDTWEVNVTRVTSLLVLTAIHDIMKIPSLLPTVQGAHEVYHGYKAGDVIGDHDHALSYVMDHYPQFLPSLNIVSEEEKRSLQFTQCELCFNLGWFVQAEAPPGAMLRMFRKFLSSDDPNKRRKQKDIALYFVHWITDLAGAEPTPLGGCEKFVLKFPLEVLNSFLASFEFVQRIATNTETEVMEEYLKARWAETQGTVIEGDDAIAKMRIFCMAQGNAPALLRAFDKLSEDEREIFSLEMARTGCRDQSYSRNLAPKEAREDLKGPALLIYYGPAFLQALGRDVPLRRLRVLKEIYRCGRTLFPATAELREHTVTIRIDTIKSMSVADMLQAMRRGDVWVLSRHNDNEAFVERSSMMKLNTLICQRGPVQVLDIQSIVSKH